VESSCGIQVTIAATTGKPTLSRFRRGSVAGRRCCPPKNVHRTMSSLGTVNGLKNNESMAETIRGSVANMTHHAVLTSAHRVLPRKTRSFLEVAPLFRVAIYTWQSSNSLTRQAVRRTNGLLWVAKVGLAVNQSKGLTSVRSRDP
jgi:hypothetical protein